MKETGGDVPPQSFRQYKDGQLRSAGIGDIGLPGDERWKFDGGGIPETDPALVPEAVLQPVVDNEL
jgi:hypothetical protein